MVYQYFSVPAKRDTQAVRVDLSKLQNYFATQKLKFAMMDNLRQDSAVLALDTSKRLTIFDPSIQQNIGLDRETTNPWLFWPVRIVLIFLIYQFTLPLVGFFFGQFKFFKNFSKKTLSRMGFKFLFKKS